MNITPEAIAHAYATLAARKQWRKPVPVYLTKRGTIIVGTSGPNIPESAALVCHYIAPLPSLAEFRSDIEHEVALASAGQASKPDQIVALLKANPRGLLTSEVAARLSEGTTLTEDMCTQLWLAGRIGRKRFKPQRGPMRSMWVHQANRAALRPVRLPAGPNGEPRCAGRKTYPGAPACPRREDCARYRAFLDTWGELAEAERMATPVHSYMCPGNGTPHFMEITLL